MKKTSLLFFALSLLFSVTSFSQIVFESGYFINDSNQKTECLIKNADCKSNPVEFEYKQPQDTMAHKATLETVREFGIYGVSKYIRAKVKIDRASNNIPYISSERNPEFQEEQLFLKVLIEGKASLFQYMDGNLVRFFYTLNDSGMTQLVYKRYLIGNKIAENNTFRQQLFVDLKCQGITLKDMETLEYTNPDLKLLFITYNSGIKSSYINYEPRQKRDFFNLTLRPGLNYSNLTINKSTSGLWDIDFGNKFRFRLGLEAEFILKYNKNKWAIIMEPTFQSYKTENTRESSVVSGGILISKVSYRSMEFPVGVRYYMYLSDQSKIFADLTYTFDFSLGSRVEFMRKDGSTFNSLRIKSRRTVGFGIGYKLKDRYSLGVRYQLGHEILGSYLSWNSSYKTLSVMFGYSFF